VYNAGPPPPPFLRVANRTANQIQFEWAEPFDNGAGIISYAVYRDSTRVFMGRANKYTDANIESGRSYMYEVSAWNIVGEGPLSAAYHIYGCRLPNKPEAYRIQHSYLGFKLFWRRPADTGCLLYKFEVFLDSEYIGEVSSFGTKNDEFTWEIRSNVHNLQVGQSYNISLASVSDGGRSAWDSQELFVAPPVVGSRTGALGIKEQKRDTITLVYHVEDDGYGNFYPTLENLYTDYDNLESSNTILDGALDGFAKELDISKLNWNTSQSDFDFLKFGEKILQGESDLNTRFPLTFHVSDADKTMAAGSDYFYPSVSFVEEVDVLQDVLDRQFYISNYQSERTELDKAKLKL